MSDFTWRHFVAGGASGITTLFVGQPFDIVKTRMQTQSQLYKNNMNCARMLLTKEGPLAFYRGAVPMLITTVPAYALQFYGFAHGKQIFGDSSIWRCGAAGSWTAFYVLPLYTATERVKCVAQTSSKYGKNDFQVLAGLWKESGLKGLVRGWEATFLRSFVGNAFYFGCYDYWKQAYFSRYNVNELPSGVSMFYGGLTGWAYWCVVMPIDTIKSKVQVSENPTKTTLVDIKNEVRQGGIKVLYRGFGPALGRAFPAHAACFLGYEQTKKFLDKYF